MTGEKIKDIRKKYELTQNELAKRLHVSTSTVGMYEQNRRVPNKKTLLALSQLFDVSIDYLLNDKKEMEVGDYIELDHIIEKMKCMLMNEKGLMFDGELITDAKEISKLFAAMKLGAKEIYEQRKHDWK